MTREEFTELPYLLRAGQVVACGYTAATLVKYAEHGVLRVVLPEGCCLRRFQKVQIACMNGWQDTLDLARWRREKNQLRLSAVCEWTGYDKDVIRHIVAAGGLVSVRPGGIGYAMFRKADVADWLGF